MRRRQVLIAALTGAGAVLALLLAGFLFWPARRGDLQCRRADLQDTITGLLVQGAEDIALNPFRPDLLVSAYNRHTDEAGGLYDVALDALLTQTDRLVPAPRVVPVPGGPPLRPHGFAVGAGGGGESAPLALIARRRNAAGGYGAVLKFFTLTASALAPAGADINAPSLCNANDMAALDAETWLVTSDRKSCKPFGRFLEDVAGRAGGALRSAHERSLNTIASDIPFANGIAVDAARVYVAATRARALLVYDRPALLEGRAVLVKRWDLPGAPDNIAFGDDGALYIAAHENLIRYALFRAGLRRDSRSVVLRYDPARDANGPRMLGVAGAGAGLDGATVALRAKDRLVLGSAYDHGLALCGLGRGAP